MEPNEDDDHEAEADWSVCSPGDDCFLRNADLFRALPILSYAGVLEREVSDSFPDGFWYFPEKGKRVKIIGDKTRAFLELYDNMENRRPAIRPYIKESPNGDFPLLDPWYILSQYDAVLLPVALELLAKSLTAAENDYFPLYSQLFYQVKREAITGGIYVPFGRDLFLCAIANAPEDRESHVHIVIDQMDFYKFLVERSGIALERLPGAVLAWYENEVQSLLAAPAADTPPDGSSSGTGAGDGDTILTNELQEYAEKLIGRAVSRGAVKNALAREDVKPGDKVKVGRVWCNVYPRLSAKEAVEHWVEAIKRK